jgi:hypothetical protein
MQLLGTRVHTVTSGTAYYSFLLKVTDLSGVDSSGTQNNFFAGFGDTLGPQDGTLLRAATRLYTRKAGSGFNLGVARNSSTPADWVFDTTHRSLNEVLFVVGCYDYNNHTAKLWINPSGATFGASAAPSPTITADRGRRLELNGIRALVLGCRTTLRPAAWWMSCAWAPPGAMYRRTGHRVRRRIRSLNAGATATFWSWGGWSGVEATSGERTTLPSPTAGEYSGERQHTVHTNLVLADAGGYSVTVSNSWLHYQLGGTAYGKRTDSSSTQSVSQTLPSERTRCSRSSRTELRH